MCFLWVFPRVSIFTLTVSQSDDSGESKAESTSQHPVFLPQTQNLPDFPNILLLFIYIYSFIYFKVVCIIFFLKSYKQTGFKLYFIYNIIYLSMFVCDLFE